jgi:hypothetical protein
LEEVLAHNVLVQNEGQEWKGTEAILDVFSGWAAIVSPGSSSVEIVSIMSQNNKVLAHWKTDYDTTQTATFYDGTPTPNRKVRGFTCFALFEIEGDKILRVTQRTDSARRHLGIE